MSKDYPKRPEAGPRTETYESRRPGDGGVARQYEQSISARQESRRSPQIQSPQFSNEVSSDKERLNSSGSSEQHRHSASDRLGGSPEDKVVTAQQDANTAAYRLNSGGEMDAVREGHAVPPLDTSHLVTALSETFKILNELSTDVSALKTEERNAKKRFDDRRVEFEKSREQHEKFPNTKAYQVDAIAQAEKFHKVVHDQLTLKAAACDSVSAQIAQTLIPGLVTLMQTTGVSDGERRLEDRCNSLEKQFESQRKDLETLRKSNQNLEEQVRITSVEQKRRAEYEKQLETELKSGSTKIERISRDLDVAMGKSEKLESTVNRLIAEASLNSNTIKSMSSQVDQIAALRPELDELKLKVSELSQQLEKASVPDQETFDSAISDIKGTIFKLANQQTATSNGLSDLIDKRAAYQQKELNALKQEFKQELKGEKHILHNSSIWTDIESSVNEHAQKLQEIESKMATLPIGISSRLETMDAAIQQHRHDIGNMKSSQDEINESLADITTGMVRQHVAAEIDPKIQALDAKVYGLELGHVSLNSLPSQVKLLQNSQQDVVQKIYKEISDLKNAPAPAALSSREIVSIIREEPGLLPDQSHYTRAFYDLNQQMIAAHDSLENLQARMNNINTNALSSYMMDQLLERFPNVHAVDLSITTFQANISQLQSSRGQMMEDIQKLQSLSVALQTQELAAAQLQDVRKQIDDLALEIDSISSMSKNDGEHVQRLAGQYNELAEQHKSLTEQHESLNEQQTNANLEMKQRDDRIRDQIKDIYGTLDRYQDASNREIASNNTTAPVATVRYSTPRGSKGQKNSGSANGPGRGAGISHLSPNRSSNRDIASASSSNKKRKLSNGHSITSYRSTSHQTGSKPSRVILEPLSTDESDNELIQPVLQSDDDDE